MSKSPEMPKFNALRPMAPDDPFYRRGYVIGVPVFGRKRKGKSRRRPKSQVGE